MIHFISETPQMEGGLFNRFTKSPYDQVEEQPVALVDYFVTSYPRLTSKDSDPFAGFAFRFFKTQPSTPFAPTQPRTIILANELFSNTRSLDNFEEEVLQETLLRSMKNKPSRSNRL